MAKVLEVLEMWQGTQILHITENEYYFQNKQRTAVEYISDSEVIIKASWSIFQHYGAAAFKLSERSTLPLTWCARDLPERGTNVLNIRRIE
jgi:hypothetical protein